MAEVAQTHAKDQYTLSADFVSKPMHTEVVIGDTIFSSSKTADDIKAISNRIAIVYPDSLEGKVLDSFIPLFFDASVESIVVPAGEGAKTRVIKEFIEDRMIESGFASDSVLVVVGGGSVIDLGGFVASTYCRGIPLVLIPTTLLAMVDAAVGGKNSINISTIKNFIGTTYHPYKVLIDIDFIRTLPKEEVANGLVEMAKHALLSSKDDVKVLEKSIPNIFKGDSQALLESISNSVQFKLKIVSYAQNEPRIRHLLNYGHTIGHAIEMLENFQLSHGKAVAIGIISEAYLAKKIGLMNEATFKEVESLMRMCQTSLKLSRQYTQEEWLRAFSMDKKSVCGKPRFVLLKEPGRYVSDNDEYCYEVPQEAVIDVTKWINSNFT